LSARAARSRVAPPAERGPVARRRQAFERYFRGTIEDHCRPRGELRAAIRYAALSPGKRLRPLLVLTSCEAAGGAWREALPAAAAVESVHAFSLVHDDLPAMDDDDYRRGRLTTHRKFGEALGVLVGDALLAFAFEELTRLRDRRVPAARVVQAVGRLAYASGAMGLVSGQALDIAAEGRPVSGREVSEIHIRKTGSLFGCAMALGALVAGARRSTVQAFDVAGWFLGMAFQIQDDLLNLGSTLQRLGKRSGTDRRRGKATYPAAVGVPAARREVEHCLAAARRIVSKRAPRARNLSAVIDALASRQN
jgi:geranylgeranyl diphosphate synthase type II